MKYVMVIIGVVGILCAAVSLAINMQTQNYGMAALMGLCILINANTLARGYTMFLQDRR
jgi:hypothetical protein